MTRLGRLSRTRLIPKMDRFTMLAIGVVLCGAVAAGLVLFVNKPAKQAKHTVVSSLQECKAEQFRCYADFFEQQTHATSAVGALTKLQEVYETDPYVKSQCHQLGHAIGHAAFTKYGSLAKAYTNGNNFCWAGYYHGVTEEAVGKLGPKRIKAEANSICAELAAAKQYSFDHYNCVHGMGHGFFSVENTNLFKALDACNLLRGDWEQESCYGGAFMENVMIVARGDGGTTAYLKPEQPLYPCTAVDTRYKQQCYLMQSSYVLQQNGYNFQKTFELCRDGPDKDFTTICYQSVGRDASGSTISNVQQTKAHCDTAPDDTALENCMLGAVRDFISYHHGITQATQLCETFDASLQPRCKQEITTYYSTF